MKAFSSSAVFLLLLFATARAQEAGQDATEPIRNRLQDYVKTFNSHDAKAVVDYWTADAVSVQEETGERTTGRDALLSDFTKFFDEYPNAKLSGTIDHVRTVGSGAAVIEGSVTLFTGGDEPAVSAFTAILEKQGDQWLIADSHERDLPTPATPYDALKELDWFVGTWRDKTEGAMILSTVQWSPSQAFLIRSYEATFEDGEGFSGTQIFGWDPLAKQIRTWIFNSDGSFGDGTASKNGDDWMVKMNLIQSDGRLASGTSVITRVDDNTLQVQKIGESIDGEPVPAAEPVTVLRVGSEAEPDKDEVEDSSAEATPAEGAEK